MRSSTCLLGFSLVIPFAALVLGGCGSSSSSGKDAGTGGSGGSPGSGGSTGTGGSTGSDGSADAGAACTPMTASAATIEAGPLWGCFEGACMAQLVACASECACNNATLGALQCVAAGGSQMTCFIPVATAGANGLPVVSCLLTSTPACGPTLDAGSEGPAGADAAGEGG